MAKPQMFSPPTDVFEAITDAGPVVLQLDRGVFAGEDLPTLDVLPTPLRADQFAARLRIESLLAGVPPALFAQIADELADLIDHETRILRAKARASTPKGSRYVKGRLL